jgi:hypothetical protein
MGRVLSFPNRPECPPHSWVAIYGPENEEDEYDIVGRICTKCSLIESEESLIVMSGGSGEGLLIHPFLIV